MKKSDLTKFFFDEIYSEPPMRNYSTNKILYIHIDEMRSTDLFDMIVYQTSKNEGHIYIFIIIDNFCKYTWAILINNKNLRNLTSEFSNILTKSKRRPLKLEWDRGAEFYNSTFQNFLKSKNIHHYSTFTDKGPTIAERVIRTKRTSLKNPVFEE